MTNLKRAYVVTVGAVTMLAGTVAAWATESETTTAVVGGGTSIKTELVAMGLAVIPLAAAPFAIKKGWRFVRSLF